MNTKAQHNQNAYSFDPLVSNPIMKQIIKKAYEIMGNPLVLIDASYKLLGCTENTDNDDSLWNELVTYGAFSHETVNFFNLENFISTVADADSVAPLLTNKLKYQRIAGKIFDIDNLQIGSVTVVAISKPLDADDESKLTAVCEWMSGELIRHGLTKYIDCPFRETFINRLVDGTFIDRQELEPEINGLYGNLGSNIYLAVADISEYDHTLTNLAYFKNTLQSLQSEYYYFLHLNNVVIIISGEWPELIVSRDLAKLRVFFKENMLYAGVSGMFQNLYQLNKYYKQALTALNFGKSSLSSQNIFLYDNYRLEHFMSSVNSFEDIHTLCNPKVNLIKEYDIAHGTNYYKMLCVYINSGAQLAVTAKTLGLKCESLKAQMDRLGELYGIDWADGDMLFSLSLTVKILENYFS